MNNLPMEVTNIERALGIYLTSDLKWNQQSQRTANIILSQVKQAFKNWTISVFNQLIATFVRPHLEYAVVVWNPNANKGIIALEKVQRHGKNWCIKIFFFHFFFELASFRSFSSCSLYILLLLPVSIWSLIFKNRLVILILIRNHI